MSISIVKKSQIYFILSFLAMILGGMLLLRFPGIMREGRTLEWADALFTATSTVCVTGLMTVNTADFTFAGQLAVLMLIQLGGLGIMTITASIIVLMGREMSFGNTLLFSNLSDRFTLRGTENLNRMVITYTLWVESVIAILLFPGFMSDGHPWPQSLWLSVFHAVTSFCNAGVSPLSASIAGCCPWVKLMIAAGTILGGLGIYVVYDCHGALRKKNHLKAQTKLILIATAVFLLAGTLGIWGIQKVGDVPSIGMLDAFFMSAAARTAGFNSVPMDIFSSGTCAVLIMLMEIGGSPGSTAGGMKVTTVALAAAAVYNTFKGNGRVLLFKREVPVEDVLKAFSLIVTYIVLTVAGGIILTALTPCSGQWAFFETASALGTVGLALDNPEEMTVRAKIFISSYMFLGRVGIFTFFVFIFGRERKSRLAFPEERIIVG